MPTIKLLVEVEIERESGMYASRDEIAERIVDAIDEAVGSADLTGLGPNGSSEYFISGTDVYELDSKEVRELWKTHERKAEEDQEKVSARAVVKRLRTDLRTSLLTAADLREKLESIAAQRELVATSIWSRGVWSNGAREVLQYLPDGKLDRIYFRVGPEHDETFSISKEGPRTIEIRYNGMGYGEMSIKPYAGNVILLSAISDK